ncbi:efflux RND transporter periplasmic adaptor subunit [Aureimonas jatrophae]|uniref:RND family efflux transporter, MFP subunit n=1 Tax=Aureimonas jatrophae TaxID=1166073 RepID=A0A1H0EKG8_9HYPH|nr:efflux RND transporter periplasmic adaptor subunit [Aureimonas jatrophae]MBB3950458.1 RND family efflux transporter MFP subunit [Aureimonas jatrophae]SDN82759.1 RND family efflux transporter, MFP subunit [Aureimonas jatrophae]
MALLRQIAATLLVLLGGLALWTWLSPVPGRYLLSENSPLPAFARPLVASLSSADDPAKVGATPQDGRRGAAPLVVTDAAVPSVTRDRLRAVGTAEAQRTVAVRPDVTGIVAAIEVRSGDAVEAGQVLMRLQSDAERVAVDRARIALAAAEDQVRRYRSLANSSTVTSVQIEEVARARDAAALDLQSAEIALAKREVRAPIAGRIGILDLDVGALVDGSTTLATVDDRSRLRIVFSTPEAFVAQLAVGQAVSVEPSARNGRAFQGAISAIDSRLDQASRTLRTEATVENTDDTLRPGQSFSVEIAFRGESFLSVDPLAIQWERAGPFVWTVAEERAAKKPVRIIERNVDRVLVASETLREGDAVVTEGVQQLRENAPVRVQTLPDLPETPALPPSGVPSASAPSDAAPVGDRRAEARS